MTTYHLVCGTGDLSHIFERERKTLFTEDLNNNKYNISCCKNLHIAVIYTELRVRFFVNVYSTLNKILKTNDFASIDWHIQCKHSAKPTVCTCTFIFVVDCM